MDADERGGLTADRADELTDLEVVAPHMSRDKGLLWWDQPFLGEVALRDGLEVVPREFLAQGAEPYLVGVNRAAPTRLVATIRPL